jgi:hypothetical protein
MQQSYWIISKNLAFLNKVLGVKAVDFFDLMSFRLIVFPAV